MGERKISDELALHIIYSVLNGREWDDALDVIGEVMVDTGRDIANPDDESVDFPMSKFSDAWDVRAAIQRN